MKLLTVLTLGLYKTKPAMTVKKSSVKKPLRPFIEDVWQLKDHSEWITPLPETITRIEILNVSRDGDKVLCRKIIQDGKAVSVKLKQEMLMCTLHSMYRLYESPLRTRSKHEREFMNRHNKPLSKVPPMPPCKPPLRKI